MSKICLVVLIGLPAAGKTSFCNEINRKLSSIESYKCHTIIYDDIIDKKIYESVETNSASFQNHYKESRSRAFASAENIIKSIISSPNVKKHLIIIDDNMYYKSMRYDYYKLAKKYKTSFLQIFIEVSLNTALVRNSKREQTLQVPESVVRDMANKLEAPEKEQWELNSLTLNSNSAFDETIFMEFFEMLEKCMQEPVCMRVEEKTGTLPATKLHNIDLLLRKIIHKKLNENKHLAEMCARKKKEIFQKIKDCRIVLSEEWTEIELCNYLENLF